MPKLIKSSVREMVLNVKEYFLEEKVMDLPKIPFGNVNKRVAAATGVSLRTIGRLTNKGRLSNKIDKPKKKRKKRQDKISLDSYDIGVLRRKIYEYYTMKQQNHTVKKLKALIKEEIRFDGKWDILRHLIKKIGFQLKKTKTNRTILMERNYIMAWRARYLQSLKHNMETEKLPVVYVGETHIHAGHMTEIFWQNDDETEGILEPISKGQRYIIVHAGGDRGFVKNSCLIIKSLTTNGNYNEEMNRINFKKWVIEMLGPNLKEPSLIIMDNAPYHNIRQNKPPTINSKKSDIIDWLQSNHLEYSDEYTKPQLIEVVRRHDSEPVYIVDDILKELGHKIIRLPSYHDDLNPIELVWESIKRKVTEFSILKTFTDIPEMLVNAINSVSVDDWQGYCVHVKKVEEEYRKKDGLMDESFVIELNSESENSSDSENDSEDQYMM